MTISSDSTLTAHKSTASGVALNIGLLSVRVDLVTAVESGRKDTAFKLGCPDCSGPVSQQYRCTTDPAHGPFAQNQTVRTRQTDTGIVVATKEEITAAATGNLPSGIVDLAVHPAADVDRLCRPGPKGYLLRPLTDNGTISEIDGRLYGLLRDLLVRRPDLALVGSLQVRSSRACYRVTLFDGQLFLEELLLPNVLRDRDQIVVDVSEAQAAQFEQVAESALVPFDPDAHYWDPAAAVAELVDALSAGETVSVAAPAPAPALDIDALLNAAIAEAAKPVPAA